MNTRYCSSTTLIVFDVFVKLHNFLSVSFFFFIAYNLYYDVLSERIKTLLKATLLYCENQFIL